MSRSEDQTSRTVELSKRRSHPDVVSTGKTGTKGKNVQVERQFYDPVPLKNIYHARGSVVSFIPASERDPEHKVPRQLRDLIAFNRRKVEMIDKNRIREEALKKLREAQAMDEDQIARAQHLTDNSRFVFDSKG